MLEGENYERSTGENCRENLTGDISHERVDETWIVCITHKRIY